MANIDPLTGGTPGPHSVWSGVRKAPKITVKGTVKVKKVRAKAPKVHTKAPKVHAPKPADPLTGQINAAADLKFGPQLAQANQAIGTSYGNQLRAGNWFSDYQRSLETKQAQQNQAAANVAAALGQIFGAQQAPLQTGNAQADALAQQASQSRSYLGQAQAGTQSQMALNTANQFGTGLIPAAQLGGRQAEQTEVNRRGQLQQAKADLLSQKGEYKTGLRSQAESTQAKADLEDRKLKLAAAIANGKLKLASEIANNITLPNTRSEIKTRRAGVRIKKTSEANKVKQNATKNQLEKNKQAEKAYLDAHPELKGKGKKPKAPFTDTQTRKSRETFRRTVALIDPAAVKKDPERTKRALVAPKNAKNPLGGHDPLMAEAVVQMMLGGGVSRKTATQFYRAYGIHLHVSDIGEKVVGGVLGALGVK